jgi:hypothetical protein
MIFLVLMLAVRPFYWPNPEMGHSPPIATRAGWISIAIMPFMMYAALLVSGLYTMLTPPQRIRDQGELGGHPHRHVARETTSLPSLVRALYV